MRQEQVQCPICKCDLCHKDEKWGNEDYVFYSCHVCGNFKVPGTFKSMLKTVITDDKTYILSGIIANATKEVKFSRNESGLFALIDRVKNYWVDLHEKNIDQLINDSAYTRTPLEKMDRLLLWFARTCPSPSMEYQFTPERDYPLIFAINQAEFKVIHDWLLQDDLIHISSAPYLNGITRKGWERIIELHKTSAKPNQAFVASWFDNSMDDAVINGIMPALEIMGCNEKVWLKTLRHNHKIDNKVIAEIRRSGLVVADFTGNRPNVYYEAGFAQGLGIPVIRTCEKAKKHSGKLQFDTRQYFHILWDDTDDLKKQLIEHIAATIPGRALMQKKEQTEDTSDSSASPSVSSV